MNTVFKVTVMLVLIVTLLCLSFGITMSIITITSSIRTSDTNVTVVENTPVMLGCYKQDIDDIVVTKPSSWNIYETVKFYFDPYNVTKVTLSNKPNIPIDNYMSNTDTNPPINYFGDYNSLYSCGNDGSITYFLSASYHDYMIRNEFGCPARLFLFKDLNSYMNFTTYDSTDDFFQSEIQQSVRSFQSLRNQHFGLLINCIRDLHCFQLSFRKHVHQNQCRLNEMQNPSTCL